MHIDRLVQVTASQNVKLLDQRKKKNDYSISIVLVTILIPLSPINLRKSLTILEHVTHTVPANRSPHLFSAAILIFASDFSYICLCLSITTKCTVGTLVKIH